MFSDLTSLVERLSGLHSEALSRCQSCSVDCIDVYLSLASFFQCSFWSVLPRLHSLPYCNLLVSLEIRLFFFFSQVGAIPVLWGWDVGQSGDSLFSGAGLTVGDQPGGAQGLELDFVHTADSGAVLARGLSM